MRLADFILANTNAILAEWDVFARDIWPEEEASQANLRNHAGEILRAAVNDMRSSQTNLQQQDKSHGQGEAGHYSDNLDSASLDHANGRVSSGFSLPAVVAEYRALRASVVRLWSVSGHQPDTHDLVDLTRFNESMDQSLAEAVRSHTLQVDRARQMFLAILSHDLRNPLNAITVSAEVLTEIRPPHPEVTDAAAQITTSAHVMTRMLRDFLDFAHTQLGKPMPVARVLTDLETICRGVVAETKAGHPGRDIRCIKRGDSLGEWDPERLWQVFSNLLGNAIQHGTADTPIQLTMEDAGPSVIFTVTNEGAPISPDLLPRIFQPLARGLSSESRATHRMGSMGLGLYITREVILAHGGSIDVNSRAPGPTTFTVRLPRQAPMPNSSANTDRAAASATGGKSRRAVAAH